MSEDRVAADPYAVELEAVDSAEVELSRPADREDLLQSTVARQANGHGGFRHVDIYATGWRSREDNGAGNCEYIRSADGEQVIFIDIAHFIEACREFLYLGGRSEIDANSCVFALFIDETIAIVVLAIGIHRH